jgi:CRISPR-associated protein Cmr5
MKQRFSKLLPEAVNAIREEFGKKNNDGYYVVADPISSEYQGYISSFGASVMQMGLLPTLANFGSQKESGGSVEDKGRLLNILKAVITCKASGISPDLKAKITDYKTQGTEAHSLFGAAVRISGTDNDLIELQAHLLDAAVATKLAIRTFKLKKK